MPAQQYSQPYNYTQIPNFEIPIKKKKKNLKFIFLGVIILILVLLLGAGLLTRKTNVNIVPKQTALTFWGMTEDESVVQSIINDYQNANPNVTIKYEKRSATNYKNNLSARFINATADTLPDIVEIDSKWTYEFNQYLKGADPKFLSTQTFDNEYFPAAQTDLEQFDSDNLLKVYGLPLESNGLVIFYNKDLINDPNSIPLSWPNFKGFAEAQTKRVNVDESGSIKKFLVGGMAMGPFNNVEYSSDILQMLIMQNRIKFPSYYKDPNAFESTDNIATAINFYKSFGQNKETDTWDKSFANSISEFANGRLAMTFGYSQDIDKIKALNPKLNFGTRIPPLVAGQIFYSGNANAIVAPKIKSNHEEAWKFMRYYTSNESLKKIFNSTKKKKVYPSKVAIKELEKDSYYAAFASIAPIAMSWKSPDLEKTNLFFKGVATNNSTYEKFSVEALITELYLLYPDDPNFKF